MYIYMSVYLSYPYLSIYLPICLSVYFWMKNKVTFQLIQK